MNVVISDPKTGRAYSKKVEGTVFENRKIGEQVDLSELGLPGFKATIAGGSDKQGFPMRSNLSTAGRKKVFVSGGVGFKPLVKGERRRKTMRGNTVSAETSQLNVFVTSYGSVNLDEALGKAAGAGGKEEELSAKERAVKQSLEMAGKGDLSSKDIKGKVKR
ncbi:MAG: 30S ribosomal protein S6e [Candidatus Diapherotrites archaeon]|nr:30S ribosomal protein S6e [Candidatus Diapherotrites archaeon]